MPFKKKPNVVDYQRRYRARNKEHIRELIKKWRKKNKEKINQKQRERYKTDATYRERLRKSSRQTINHLQLQIKKIIIKNGKCEKCGYSDLRALVIHHHFGNHAKENQYKTLKQIVDGDIPYSILCANCHMILHNPRKM